MTPRSLMRSAQTWLAEKSLRALNSVPGSRWLWPLIQETSAGGWQRNEDVEFDTALSNPTLYACITLIAGDIAKLRLKLVEKDDSGVWPEVTYDSPFMPVIRKPNPYQSTVDFYEWWMMSKLGQGNTYVLKARDERGMVTQMHVLDPNRVRVLVSDQGDVFYQLSAEELADIREQVVVPAREIIHDRCCPSFHPLVGVTPIYAAGYPALQGLTIRRSSETFFRNGSRPGGVLSAPGAISQDTAERLKAHWEANFSGNNIGKVAVLGDGLKYEPMAFTADQARLVEQLRMSDEDIAKCFHMPRYKVGVGPDPAYNNIAALNQEYAQHCLQKHIVKLEACLDEGLGLTRVKGKTIGVEFERDDLFQMDSEARIKAAEGAVKAGASPNEVRRRYMDLGPTPGGDQPFLQQQMWPIRMLAERTDMPAAASAPSSPPDDESTATRTAFRMAKARLHRQYAEAA